MLNYWHCVKTVRFRLLRNIEHCVCGLVRARSARPLPYSRFVFSFLPLKSNYHLLFPVSCLSPEREALGFVPIAGFYINQPSAVALGLVPIYFCMRAGFRIRFSCDNSRTAGRNSTIFSSKDRLQWCKSIYEKKSE